MTPLRLLVLLLLATSVLAEARESAKVEILVDPDSPSASIATIGEFSFPVGLGRKGITPAGKVFQPGRTLPGRFRIDAILSADRFAMAPALITQSGKTQSWLRSNLFRNMSSIDFDGDGNGGEYGKAFLALTPIDSTAAQPFRFAEYKGVFRYYSFALHGTQDQARIGKCSTGGCINIGQDDLRKLLPLLSLGDEVVVRIKE